VGRSGHLDRLGVARLDVWRMYYTGLSQSDGGQIQSIGMTTSSDLTNWRRDEKAKPLRADPRWYESCDHGIWREEAWRDPWIYADANGDGWHMLTTARANVGRADDRGVIGHARSDDLEHWEQTPPLSAPGGGFGHLEVPQVEVVHGQPVLIFSCLREDMAAWRRQRVTSRGIWIARGESTSGPFDVAGAELLTDETFYSGRIIQDQSQQWMLLAFRLRGDEGRFHGSLADPMPLVWKSSYRVPQVG
jgi:beta-fructofuranosidase